MSSAPSDREVIAKLLEQGFGRLERLTEFRERVGMRALMTSYPRISYPQFIRCLWLVEHMVINEEEDEEDFEPEELH
jgi:hypothetical protein